MSVRLRFTLALAMSGFVATALWAVSASSGALRNPDYVGKGKFDKTMRVAFTIKERHGKKLVTFQPKRIKRFCEDGSTRRDTFGPVTVPLKRDRTFQYIDLDTGEGTRFNDHSLDWFEGRLLGKGRAKGFVANLFDPWGAGDNTAVHCSTFGKVRWRAARV